jgi:DNA-directed RNA polymerase specialized sigma24 family protein
MQKTSPGAFPSRAMTAEELPPEPEILELSARILASCVLAGLNLDDANDVAQDIWTWLLLTGRTKQAFLVPWLDAVAKNFCRRLWRRRARDGRVLEALRRQPTPRFDLTSSVELRRSLDELCRRMRSGDRALLALMERDGLTFAEAAKAIGLLPGSRSRARHRLQKTIGVLRTPASRR